MRKTNELIVNKINGALNMEREVIGVKFMPTKEDYINSEVEPINNRMSYCKMIEKASKGDSMKVTLDNFACFAGARVLGLVEIDNWYKSGNYYNSCGLYQDRVTSKQITERIEKCNHNIYGIVIQPLSFFSSKPDVVIIISNPYNIMRLVQGYAYIYGAYENNKFLGNQAFCSECTAAPYEKNDINISLLCIGAREKGISDSDMGIGIAYSKVNNVVDGLINTINVVESNSNKKEIEGRYQKLGITDIKIIYNKSYGTPLYKYDNKYFLDLE